MSTTRNARPESPGETLGVVVVAAGRSQRMGGTDKTFADVHGAPLVAHTLSRISRCDAVAAIALVVAEDSVTRAEAMLAERRIGKVVAVCAGGERRQDSVYAGLRALGRRRWVAVHDGARPCVTEEMMERGLEAARRWSAAVAAVPVKDTIKVVGPDDLITDTPERSTLWAAQTPQVFDYELLMQAHRAATADYTPGYTPDYTDDAAMVEALGRPVRVFLGSYENLKVTTPEDLAFVSQLLAKPHGPSEQFPIIGSPIR